MRNDMTARLKGALYAVVLAAAVAVPVLAHHSGAMFEETKEVTLSGVVKEFQFTNPHSWLLVDVKGQDGKVTTDSKPRVEQHDARRHPPEGLRAGTPVTITDVR
jgi:hypothetical protein